jgi:hypothetical protein
MKSKQMHLIGIALCLVGAACVYIVILNSVGKQPAGLKTMPGFVIMLLGAYIVYIGKKEKNSR